MSNNRICWRKLRIIGILLCVTSGVVGCYYSANNALYERQIKEVQEHRSEWVRDSPRRANK